MAEEDFVVSGDIIPELNTTLPTAPDTVITEGDIIPKLDTNLPSAPDTIIIIPDRMPIFDTNIPSAPDTFVNIPDRIPELAINIPTAPDTTVTIPDLNPELNSNIPSADDVPLERAEFSFARGKWLPKGDALAIGEENFSDIENWRYTDFGLEGVGGFTKINSTALSSQGIRNAIQLTTNFQQSSYVVMHIENDVNAGYIVQNRGTIPSTAEYPFTITTGTNDKLEFDSNESGGSWQVITLTDGTYNDGGDLAIEIATQMNANATLTGGVITFVVDYNITRDLKFTIDATVGKTIKLDYSDSNAADTIGFTADTLVAAQTITSNIPVEQWIEPDNTIGDKIARFSLLPNGHIGWCSDAGSFIWAGEERKINAFIESDYKIAYSGNTHLYHDDLYVQDKTDMVCHDDTMFVAAGTTTDKVFLIGSTRELDGMYIKKATTANIKTASMSFKYWDGNSWESISNVVDDTQASNGVTLGQNGWVTWDEPSSEPYYCGGYYLYFYELTITGVSGLTTNSGFQYITTRSRPQVIGDIWDGIYRIPILFYVYDKDGESGSETGDYTLIVANRNQAILPTIDSNDMLVPIANIGSASAYAIVSFEEPIAGLEITLAPEGSGTPVRHMTVYYGNNFASSINDVRDTTAYTSPGSTNYLFNHNGSLLFDTAVNNATSGAQRMVSHGVYGYHYKLQATDMINITNTIIKIDTIRGIVATNRVIPYYKFPFQYQNRAMWCNSQKDGEYNRVDYSKTNAPDVYNGEDASGYHHERSLYFGSEKPLTGAVQLFNQYGEIVDTIGLFFKNTETYMLTGYSPETFKIRRISEVIGCPAPLTITSAQISYKAKDAPTQNVALWLSDKGPKMFIGNTIRGIEGVENYFQPGETETINTSYFGIANAWFDPTYQEWNLLVPSGSGQTTNNIWLIYDLIRDRWYKKSVNSSAEQPQGAFPVVDSNGNQYIYGFSDDYLLRLENGLNWGSASYDIENKVTTSDFFFTKSLWDITRLRRLVSIFKTNSAGDVTVDYYKDTRTTPETVSALPSATAMTSTGHRARHLISYLDLRAWVHRLSFTIKNATSVKPVLLGFGAFFQRVYEELKDRDDYDTITISDAHDVLLVYSSQNAELVTNGDFTDWTGDNPDNWTVDITGGESASNYITEVSGKCRLVSDGTFTSMGQNILTIGKTYRYSINITSITGAVDLRMGGISSRAVITTTGVKTGTLICAESGVFIIVRNTACDVTFDDVSIKEYIDIDVPDGTYTIDAALHALEDALNDDSDLIGTFTVTFPNSRTNIAIDSGTLAYYDTGSDGGAKYGFTSDKSVAASITADSALSLD